LQFQLAEIDMSSSIERENFNKRAEGFYKPSDHSPSIGSGRAPASGARHSVTEKNMIENERASLISVPDEVTGTSVHNVRHKGTF
jgi:hypothetical protein